MIIIAVIAIVAIALFNAKTDKRSRQINAASRRNGAWKHPATRAAAAGEGCGGVLIWILLVCALLLVFGVIPAGAGLVLLGK
jgi:uncharacterized membrane protein